MTKRLKRLSDEEFEELPTLVPNTTAAMVEAFRCAHDEAKRARTSEARLLALLREVPQFDCHPSEGRHSDLCKAIRKELRHAAKESGNG